MEAGLVALVFLCALMLYLLGWVALHATLSYLRDGEQPKTALEVILILVVVLVYGHLSTSAMVSVIELLRGSTLPTSTESG